MTAAVWISVAHDYVSVTSILDPVGKLKIRFICCGFFSVRIEINRNRAFCSIFDKAIAKKCHFLLIKLTVIRKISQFAYN